MKNVFLIPEVRIPTTPNTARKTLATTKNILVKVTCLLYQKMAQYNWGEVREIDLALPSPRTGRGKRHTALLQLRPNCFNKTF